MKLDDAIIRKKLHESYLKKYHDCKKGIVIDELGLNHGSCRADIAVFNDKFIGYEIKSDKDTLTRLDNQIKAYDMIFDHSFIVIGEYFYPKIISFIPKWWGIILSKIVNSDTISFIQIRDSKRNTNSDLFALSKLLWKKEVIEILEQYDNTINFSYKSRSVLCSYLCEIVNVDDLKSQIVSYLKSRNNWRHHQLLFRYDD